MTDERPPEVPDHITASAARAYRALVEQDGAPVWTHPRQDRLTPAMRPAVAAFARQLVTDPPRWGPAEEPAWIQPWLRRRWRTTPGHAARGPLPDRLVDIPTTDRTDLAADVSAFVPTTVTVEELLAHQTSGTAGAPTTIPGHPVSTARYYPLILAAAAPRVQPHLRPDRLDWVTVISQQVGGFVIPSWSSTTGTLTAQLNLQPHTWHRPEDRGSFLEHHDPRCITGDPVAFADLLALAPDIHPQLLVSTASALSDGLRSSLEQAFGAVVIDVYSVTECGPIAVSVRAGSPHHLLQPHLFVEAVRPDGSRCDPDESGEITVTGGMNTALSLIRYRTGDHGALSWPAGRGTPVLTGLHGRTPVVFAAADGGQVNSHSVTVALRPLALPRFTLEQDAAGELLLGLDRPEGAAADRAVALVTALLGQPVRTRRLEAGDAKVVPFRASPPGHVGPPPMLLG